MRRSSILLLMAAASSLVAALPRASWAVIAPGDHVYSIADTYCGDAGAVVPGLDVSEPLELAATLDATCASGALAFQGTVSGSLATVASPTGRLGSDIELDATDATLPGGESFLRVQDVGLVQAWRAESTSGMASGRLMVALDAEVLVSFPELAGFGDASIGYELSIPELGISELRMVSLSSDGSSFGSDLAFTTLMEEMPGVYRGTIDDLLELDVLLADGSFSVDLRLFTSAGLIANDAVAGVNGSIAVLGNRTVHYGFAADAGSTFQPLAVPEPASGLLLALGGASLALFRRRGGA